MKSLELAFCELLTAIGEFSRYSRCNNHTDDTLLLSVGLPSDGGYDRASGYDGSTCRRIGVDSSGVRLGRLLWKRIQHRLDPFGRLVPDRFVVTVVVHDAVLGQLGEMVVSQLCPQDSPILLPVIYGQAVLVQSLHEAIHSRLNGGLVP